MNNQFIEIEQFAKLAGLSVSTIRRKIKSLSETDKKWFIRRVPIVGSGGEKILIDKSWLDIMNTHNKASNDDVSTHDEPNDTPIIEILRGQLAVKDAQIADLSHTNKELLERLKEVNYTLATAQKQLSTPTEEKLNDMPKWWQFWK